MNIDDKELLAYTQNLVQKEKKLTAEILKYLAEIERRKLYCDMGLSSLHKYCTYVLKYSDTEASIRIRAMRLAQDSKMAKKEIESGKLNLTTASQLQTFFRQQKTTAEDKEKIVQKVSGKSKREAEKIMQSNVTGNCCRKKKIILEERILKKLDYIQDELQIDSELEAIEALLDAKISEIKMNKAKRRSKGGVEVRHIKRDVKEAIITRSGNRCEYVATNGKRCNCRTNLQWDHIKPIAKGGKSTIENMRLVCFSHNQRFAIKELGQSKMDRYYKRQVSLF